MKNWKWLGILLIPVVLALGADEVKKPRGVFSKLRIRQRVTLKQEASGLTVSFFDGEEAPLPHKVIEIGDDFIVVEDIANTRETTVPIYALRSIEKVRTKGN